MFVKFKRESIEWTTETKREVNPRAGVDLRRVDGVVAKLRFGWPFILPSIANDKRLI